MKAKDYAARIQDSIETHRSLPQEEQIDFLVVAIHGVGLDMITEMNQMVADRKATTHYAMAAVVREQYMKWRAMCRIVAKNVGEELLDPEGFKVIIKSAYPAVVTEYMNKYGWK